MPPPSCSSAGPSSPGIQARQSFGDLHPRASWQPEVLQTSSEQYLAPAERVERVLEATPIRTDILERELQDEREAVQRAAEANTKLAARLEEAEQEVSFLKARLSDEKSKAEHQSQSISVLKASLSEEKAKAERTSLDHKASLDHLPTPYAASDSNARLEDQIGSLQVRYNTLKKQYDGKGMQSSELTKQLDAKNKELLEKDKKLEEKEGKLQDSLKENKNIRQKMVNFSKDAQLADAEHRRIASAGRLMTPGEFARMMKSSEARNNFSQENARLFHRNEELETESRLHGKVLSLLREKGLGHSIDEVWQDVSAPSAIEDPDWDHAR